MRKRGRKDGVGEKFEEEQDMGGRGRERGDRRVEATTLGENTGRASSTQQGVTWV